MKAKIDKRFRKLKVAMRQNQTDINNLARLMEMNRQAIIKLENEREQPKLKRLDQSVFDGLDEKWRFAAVDEDGKAFVYMSKPEIDEYGVCFIDGGVSECKRIGEGYDASNWKESLIERESKELIGSDLCRKMLERGDEVVLCAVSDCEDFTSGFYDAIYSVDEDGLFESHCSFWWYVQPVNNQGEPLTASEVGL